MIEKNKKKNERIFICYSYLKEITTFSSISQPGGKSDFLRGKDKNRIIQS